MLNNLIRQFHLTRAERHGAVALLLIAAFTWLAPELYYHFRPVRQTDFSDFIHLLDQYAAATNQKTVPASTLFAFDPNTASVEDFIRLGLKDKVAQTIIKYREHGGRFRSEEDLQKIYTLPKADFERLRPFVRIGAPQKAQLKPQPVLASLPAPELFLFDPNTATEAELRRLGLAPALAARWLHYREKGGFFIDKTDVKKLYGLNETDYLRLEPYITIAQKEIASQPAAYAGGSGSARKMDELPLDINTATPEDWQRLPGVGGVRAYKIVRFREKLGGFCAVEQVRETAGLPDSIFQKIHPRLQLGAPVIQKINLNTTTVDELAGHPYFSRKQAQIILNYREQHGPFSRLDDLWGIVAFSSEAAWLAKIKPYISVE